MQLVLPMHSRHGGGRARSYGEEGEGRAGGGQWGKKGDMYNTLNRKIKFK